jgi:peptidoglycan/LPS O-acetylase OafA/YrhL
VRFHFELPTSARVSHQQQNYGFKYRPEVDGLRALAVTPVVLYHAGLGMTGGFVGVDVFFVISGYLITGLILKELSRGTFSLKDFWERRARRILPAMSVMVLATLVAGYFFFLPWDYEELGRSVIAQSVFGANFHFWAQSGYFDGPAEMKPLLHTWSLAVEEQFYLLFPALLLLIWRRLWKHARGLLITLWVLSFLLSVVGSHHFADATFYLLPARAWELLTGALLALYRPSMKPVSRPALAELASALGLGLILLACFCFDAGTRFPGASALLPCAGTALFLWANESRVTLSGRILSLKPFVFVGLVSYSWYLWHWPAFAYLNRIYLDEVPAAVVWAVVFGSFLMAILSWRLVETPFRTRRLLPTRRGVSIASASAILMAIAAGLFLDATDGMPGRVPESVIRLSEQERNPEFRKKNVLEDAKAGTFQSLGLEAPVAGAAKFLLWGDSHGIAVAPVLDELAKEYGYVGYAALRAGNPPLLGVWIDHDKIGRKAIEFNDAVLEFIKKEKIDRVLLAGRWAYYYSGKGDGTMNGLIIGEDETEASFAGAARAMRESLNATVSALEALGVEIFLLEQVPDQRFDVPRELADRVWRGMPVDELGIDRATHDELQRPIQEIFESFGNRVSLIDPADYFFEGQVRMRLIHDGQSLYIDEDHVSDAGAEQLRPLLQRAFAE